MHDNETQQRFIELRSKGCTFVRIAEELKVCKRTLITWSRRFQFEINNLRAIELEALRFQVLATREAHVQALGEQLHQVEEELKKRDITELPTSRLFALAESLRRQILRETGEVQFTTPIREIPNDEFHEEAQTWQP
ncbi:MAG: hypothetical protein H0X66_18440 [Verrucomicrobia bacterium]|jgi:hypothetical protein|nr:hypothetical protein [Verrucomicrobiota bacterium]